MTEATPKHASLMELTVAKFHGFIGRNSPCELHRAIPVERTSGPLKAGYGFDARTDLDLERKKLIVHASLTACGKRDSDSDIIVDDQMVIEAEFVLIYAVDSLEGITEEALMRLAGLTESTTCGHIGVNMFNLPPFGSDSRHRRCHRLRVPRFWITTLAKCRRIATREVADSRDGDYDLIRRDVAAD